MKENQIDVNLNFKNNMNTIVKYNPVVDHFFNAFLGDANGGSSKQQFRPAVEALENEKAFELHLYVPGLGKEDFELTIEDRKLKVSGERKRAELSEDVKFHIKEVAYGKFSRTFNLPKNADQKKIKASYLNGILTVTIPKDSSKALKTTIEVK